MTKLNSLPENSIPEILEENIDVLHASAMNEEYEKNQGKRKKKETRRNLVSKYVQTALLTILAGLILCGSIIISFSKNYFDSDTWDELLNQASIASSYTANNLVYTPAGYQPEIGNLTNAFLMLSATNNNDIILTNMEGQFMMNQHGVILTEHDGLPDVINEIISGGEDQGFKGFSTLGGYYEADHHIIGLPVYGPVGDEAIGYIITTSSGDNLTHYLNSVFRIFLVASIAVLAFTFTVTTITTESLLRPINEVSAVAKSYGNADFSKRVSVDPNSFDELNQLAITLNNMANSLALHEKSTRSFVANVSHELKTPMTTISGFIDGILDGTIPEKDHVKYLKIVSEEVKRLARLTQSMLNLSKIEAGEMPMNPVNFDVNQVLIQVILGFENRIEGKNIDILNLDPDNKNLVRGDPDLVYQVLYNLVDNAVKFVNEGGYLAFYYETVENMINISVRNSGKGLTKEEVNQVFERFYKTDRSRSLDKTGVGLGLYIVKTIMNLHGGKVSVESVEDEYVQFTVSLPKGEQK